MTELQSKREQKKAELATEREELTAALKRWQEIEATSIEQCTAIIQKTENPLIRLIMEIIRQDSAMHKRVQQVMIDSMEQQALSLTPEELAEVWEMVEQHIELEKETIQLAEKARRNSRLFIQRHLLAYLLEDEEKHEHLLERLEDFKRQLYPYA